MAESINICCYFGEIILSALGFQLEKKAIDYSSGIWDLDCGFEKWQICFLILIFVFSNLCSVAIATKENLMSQRGTLKKITNGVTNMASIL